MIDVYEYLHYFGYCCGLGLAFGLGGSALCFCVNAAIHSGLQWFR